MKKIFFSILLILSLSSCSHGFNKHELTKNEKELLRQIRVNDVYSYKYNFNKETKIKFIAEIYHNGAKETNKLESNATLKGNKKLYIVLSDDKIAINGSATKYNISNKVKNIIIKQNQNVDLKKEEDILLVKSYNKNKEYVDEKIFSSKEELDNLIKESEYLILIKLTKTSNFVE